MKKLAVLFIGIVGLFIWVTMIAISHSPFAVQAEEVQQVPGTMGGQWAYHYGGSSADVASAVHPPGMEDFS